MTDDRYNYLLIAYRSGDATADEVREFESAMQSDPSLRHRFIADCNLDAGIIAEAEYEPLAPNAVPAPRRLAWWPHALTAAAAVLLTVLIIGNEPVEAPGEMVRTTPATAPKPISPPPDNAQSEAPAPGQTTSIGTLTHTFEAKWSGTPPVANAPLPPGELHLLQGIAQIKLTNDTTIVLEGPASLTINTPQECYLEHGKIWLHVPAAAPGLHVATPAGNYRDIGTTFGLERLHDGREILDVFDGQVTAEHPEVESGIVTVAAPAGLHTAPDHTQIRLPPRKNYYWGSTRLQQEIARQQVSEVNQWRHQRQHWADHPNAFLFFDFELSPGDRTLPNRVEETNHGTIIGCQHSQGRWPGKGALDFKRPNDRVRLDVPGEFDEVTLVTWIRFDGFDRWSNAILLPDQFANGELHWQVRQRGRIDLGIKPPNNRERVFLTRSAVNRIHLGRWLHLAVSASQHSQRVKFYRNGELIDDFDLATGAPFAAKDPITAPYKFRIGQANLGNFSPADPTVYQPTRHLNGRIDAFYAFSRELTHREVADHFRATTPGFSNK